MERIEFTSASPSDTLAIGEHIGTFSRIGDLFLLCGELGSGKTQLVKGIARGLGVPEWEYVLSPSFTLVNLYEGRMTLCHVDLYRLGEGDVQELALEEYLDTGIVAVEWAERTSWWDNHVRVTIEVSGEWGRRIAMEVGDVGRAKVWRDFSSKH
jgi:tRNA threonylcarbamoyladenosine biosynthesis protein TsaE